MVYVDDTFSDDYDFIWKMVSESAAAINMENLVYPTNVFQIAFQAKSVQNFLTYFTPTLRVVWMQDLKNVRTVLEYTSGMLERALRTDSKYIHHRSNSAPSLKTVSIPNLPVALPGSLDIG